MTSIITEDTPVPVKLAKTGLGSDLVLLPFRPSSSAGIALNGLTPDGSDGSRTNWYQSITASVTWANTVVARIGFNNNIFGLRFNRQFASPIGVRIDGVAYEVGFEQRLNVTTQAAADYAGWAEGDIIATDLGDGPHEAEIVLPCSVAQTRIVQIYGVIVEARGNPTPPVPGISLLSSALVVPASGTYIALTPSNYSAIGFSGLCFVNTTGADITVSLRYSSGNGVFATVLVPANGSAQWSPPGNRPIYHPIELTASAVGVNAFVGAMN